MKEQKITIEIDHYGRLTADAEGFSGDACLKDIEKLLDGMASIQETIERKPEAGERLVRQTQSVKLGGKKKL